MKSMKKLLIYGLGISGLSALKALSRFNVKITVLDKRNKVEIKNIIDKAGIKKDIKIISSGSDLEKYDLVIKSPGIKPDELIMEKLYSQDLDIVTDIELASRLSDFSKTILITGSNGKTTVTSLIYSIISQEYRSANLLGNIGKGILDIDLEKDNINIIELSSFQLHDTKKLRAKYNVVLNISEDHLDWHNGFEDYINSKFKLFLNTDETDFAILNYDDELIREKAKNINANILWFSKYEELKRGVFYKNGKIIILNEEDYQIDYFGDIIIENILAAVATCYCFGIEIDMIQKGINKFKPLEHRMEFVKEISGIKYINDSKATNPESTIKALESLDGNIILIAGGYDKGSNFDNLTNKLTGKVKSLILFGENKMDIKNSAKKLFFEDIIIADDMKSALIEANKIAEKGDTVLLSPASASWDMYPNYEIRGNEFKELLGD